MKKRALKNRKRVEKKVKIAVSSSYRLDKRGKRKPSSEAGKNLNSSLNELVFLSEHPENFVAPETEVKEVNELLKESIMDEVISNG